MEVKRLYQLPQAPGLGLVLRRSIERLQLLLGRAFAPSVGLDLFAVVEGGRGVEQDEVADTLGVAQGVLERDEPPERVAQHADLLEAQVLTQGVGV